MISIAQTSPPQDDASPAALTDLCLAYLSQNLERFCVMRPDGSLCFRDAILFPQELADQLLAKMATEGKSGAKMQPRTVFMLTTQLIYAPVNVVITPYHNCE